MCLVARAGPCDAESASTQEDDYAALCWQALIQLMRERATSLDAILPVLREKRVATARHCRRGPACAYPAIRDGWRVLVSKAASLLEIHHFIPILLFHRDPVRRASGAVSRA